MGFFEIAIAAPSMKAAAEAWGVDPDIFRRGFAEQTEDKKIVDAAMAAPGVVLRRPVGSDGAFGEKAALPEAPPDTGKKHPAPRADKPASKSRPDLKLVETEKREEAAARKRAEAAEREKEAAAAREKEEKRRELERRKKEAEEARARKQREQKIARVNAAFERARARHDEVLQSLTKRRKELDDDEAREDERWEREQREHADALREAGS